MNVFQTLALGLLFASSLCHAEGILRSAAELTRYIDGAPTEPAGFAITATVTHTESKEFIFVKDKTGVVRLVNTLEPRPQPGDVISAIGQISFCPVGNAKTSSNSVITIIGHVPPPRPEALTLAQLDPHRHDSHLIVTEGKVVDVFRDEIDDQNMYLMLKDGDARYPVALKRLPKFNAAKYLEARVRVYGLFLRRVLGYRTYSGPYIEISEPPEILVPPPADPFSAPLLRHYPVLTPQEVANLPRQAAVGHVLATWSNDRFLLHTPEEKNVLVQLIDGTPLPQNGAAVKVVGFPTTDLFHINLTRAIFRPEPDLPPLTLTSPENIMPQQLMADSLRPTPDAIRFHHGRLVRFRGVVQNPSGLSLPTSQLILKSDEILTTVDAGASGLVLGTIPAGSEVDVTGICVFAGENWSPERTFPRLHGLLLVLRSFDDLVIVHNPPWWTLGRLTAAVVFLFLGLLVFILWNRHLNRLVSRRGHELAREKIKKESAQLKIDERTRLAVELHDSLSQNLEGVACQLVASRNVLKTDTASAVNCLDTAERMLDSCRLELKRCLFDLRGHALEEKNLADAIRTTLVPLCDGIDLGVRFDVRRANFDDTTAHAILCTIRELVSNALRHGRASKIRIAGEYHEGVLNFSVRDNGCGFDTATRPGPDQGHFGLEGIRERAERFNGATDIKSQPGIGTRVAITLHLNPKQNIEQE